MTDTLFDDIPAGAVITDIRPLPSDPSVRSIRVGRRAVAHLRAVDVDAIGLAKGTRWTKQTAEAVQRAVETNRTRKAALRLLGRRAYASAELRERLARKEHDVDAIETVISELTADGWLDDAAYGESIARQTIERRPAGERLLRRKLAERRIDDDLAERIVRRTLAEVDQLEAAIGYGRERMRKLGWASPAAVRRVGAALARRGFDEETVQTALDRLGLTLADDDRPDDPSTDDVGDPPHRDEDSPEHYDPAAD
jgi:regulatory protein